MKKEKGKITFEISATTAIVIISVIIFSAVAYAFVSSRYGSSYQQALASENPEDICKAPAGYTEESWREHMSHHPDRYSRCLHK